MMTKSLTLTALLALTTTAAFAQSPTPAARDKVSTRIGHEFNISVQHYDYTEPEPAGISIHGPKFGGEYTGTFALNTRHRWYAQLNARGTGVIARYDGWCRPWQIEPSTSSANGYRLTLGTRSPCSSTGNSDWYVDGRAITGKDLGGNTWAVSPFVGVGFRHLSNGVTGNFNYRTQEYLYVPAGVTLRTTAVAGRPLGVTVEYDGLVRGWNTTRNSLLGGGTVPATSSTPAFTLSDFTDLSFDQRKGSGLRASAAYQATKHWSIEPYYVRWHVSTSSVNDGSVAYTVNGITARRTLSYIEPLNFTHEFGIKIGFRLR